MAPPGGEIDDKRHRRDEADRRARRKAAKSSKSESQLEKERKRKEHAARVLANQRGRSPSGRGTPSKGAAKDDDGGSSVFAAMFTQRAQGFMVDLNFRNAPPRPPVGPCFVGPGLEGELTDKWTRYRPFNAVEANYVWRLHAEPDLGVPLAPSAMDLEGCYVDPTKPQKKDHDMDDEAEERPAGPPPLHRDDAALLNWTGSLGDTAAEELQVRRDRAKAAARAAAGEGGAGGGKAIAPKAEFVLKRQKEEEAAEGAGSARKKRRGVDFTSRVLDEKNQFWMKKTTYLTNDQSRSVHAFTSLADTKKKTALEVDKKLKKSTEEQSDAQVIDKAFSLAAQPTAALRHPTKKDVTPVLDVPFLPSVHTWGHTYTHVVLDNPPKATRSRRPVQPEQLDRAFVADVDNDAGRMECHLLVPSDVAKSSTGEDTLYDVSQRYDLDVFPLKDDGPHVNFVLMIDEENGKATYHPLNSRVQLSTGRPAGRLARAAIVERRAMGEEDVKEMESRVAEVDEDLARKHGTYGYAEGGEGGGGGGAGSGGGGGGGGGDVGRSEPSMGFGMGGGEQNGSDSSDEEVDRTF